MSSADLICGDGLPSGRWPLFLLLILIVLMILPERVDAQVKIKSMSKRFRRHEGVPPPVLLARA